MKHCVVRLAIAITVPTIAFAQASTFTAAQRVEGQEDVKQVAKLLSDKLKDPSSAKFRNTFIQKHVGTDGLEHITLCGEVNAKNSYGGMTGFHHFMLLGNQVLIGGQGEFLDADMLCSNNNPIIDSNDLSIELRKVFDTYLGQ